MTSTSERLDRVREAFRRTAEMDPAELRRRVVEGPSPGEVFGKRVAEILRDTADRLRSPEPGEPADRGRAADSDG